MKHSIRKVNPKSNECEINELKKNNNKPTRTELYFSIKGLHVFVLETKNPNMLNFH